jgi:uncharacterized membrane protein YccC
MAPANLSTLIRKRLDTFARRLASPFTDSRRQRFARLREALRKHPWRLPKAVTYLFDWIAQMIRELLHPRPKIQLAPE